MTPSQVFWGLSVYCGYKWAAASCLISLPYQSKLLCLKFVSNQGSHSVIRTTNLFLQCIKTQILLLLTQVDQKSWSVKRKLNRPSDIKQCLQHLEKRSMIEDKTKHAFEVKQVVRPVTSGCCQRLVGCKDCLDMWLAHSYVCPLCKGNSMITAKMELKGSNDHLALFPSKMMTSRLLLDLKAKKYTCTLQARSQDFLKRGYVNVWCACREGLGGGGVVLPEEIF